MPAPKFFPVHAAAFRVYVLNGEGRVHVTAMTMTPAFPPAETLACLHQTFVSGLTSPSANDLN